MSSRSTSRPASRSARACSSSARASDVSPSTVRGELAELETLGLLTHPHTSAGRTPTESGYRLYAEELVDALEGRPDELGVDLRSMRDEIEQALRTTTEMLSDATRLLALVSAPSLETASIRHIEVLTAAADERHGRRDHVDRRRDEAGLQARRAGRPRPRRLGGRVPRGSARRRAARLERRFAVGSRRRSSRRASARSSRSSARRCSRWAPRPGRRSSSAGRRASSSGARVEEVEATMRLVELLERRAAVLELVSEALEPQRPVVHVGPEVGGRRAARRLARRRDLRDPLDAARCRRPRRPAAHGLREGDPHRARRRVRALPLRRGRLRRRLSAMATTESDYYELLGVSRGASDAEIKQCVPHARARAASRRLERARRGARASATSPRRTRCSPTPSVARRTTASGRRASSAAASSRCSRTSGASSDIFAAFFGEDLLGGGGRTAARAARRRRPGRRRDRPRGGVRRARP